MRAGPLLWISFVLTISCGNKGAAKVGREECAKVADHITDLIMDHYTAHPDELWLEVGSAADSGLPAGTTEKALPGFLGSPEGKTWLLQRRGFVRSATEGGMDKCIQSASRKQVDCLLAAKSREAVTACDSVK
jgi:hypothetical protein